MMIRNRVTSILDLIHVGESAPSDTDLAWFQPSTGVLSIFILGAWRAIGEGDPFAILTGSIAQSGTLTLSGGQAVEVDVTTATPPIGVAIDQVGNLALTGMQSALTSVSEPPAAPEIIDSTQATFAGVATFTADTPIHEEGDLLVLIINTRNARLDTATGPSGTGWSLYSGTGISGLGTSMQDPWTSSNEHLGIWTKQAGASEPASTSVVASTSASGARAMMAAIRGASGLGDRNSAFGHTAPSVNAVSGGGVLGVYSQHYLNNNDTVDYDTISGMDIVEHVGLVAGNAGQTRLIVGYATPAPGATGTRMVSQAGGAYGNYAQAHHIVVEP